MFRARLMFQSTAEIMGGASLFQYFWRWEYEQLSIWLEVIRRWWTKVIESIQFWWQRPQWKRLLFWQVGWLALSANIASNFAREMFSSSDGCPPDSRPLWGYLIIGWNRDELKNVCLISFVKYKKTHWLWITLWVSVSSHGYVSGSSLPRS